LANRKILVTGAAGFIGFHLSKRLVSMGDEVVGLDSLNDYYDVNLKLARLKQMSFERQFRPARINLADRDALARLFAEEKFDIVVNLAAQAGVRYSLVNPHAYIESNVDGFLNILEGCRHNSVKHLVFASSSSVYGANKNVPFSVHHNVDHPVSLYAATKKSNELMAHTYAHLYRVPCTGLRFFTVYGPWGRPDMAYFLFTRAILGGKPIDVFNHGKMQRDFTYIDDIIEGVIRVIERVPGPNPDWSGSNPDAATSYAPYRLYNIGSNKPVELMHFIEVLERCLGKKAEKNMLPMQAGDVPVTYADIDDLVRDTGFRPTTSIEEGLGKFVEWYNGHFLDNGVFKPGTSLL
jgi:UDP-glucuronate 4-epimerase